MAGREEMLAVTRMRVGDVAGVGRGNREQGRERGMYVRQQAFSFH